ncbi:MAG: DUF4926 domain-containing protein [Phycisphaerales bacterium]|nr:DUF4926 domain-containing protein [Phycisphaerales bacterium]
MLKEHDVVTAIVNVPAEGLLAGDVGAVVHCYPEGDVYEVDFLDEQGRHKCVATLTGQQVMRLNLVSLSA